MNKIEELLPFYALGVLTDEENELVEAYLAKNPSANNELAEMAHVVDLLPAGIEPIEPSPTVKSNLMERIQTTAEQPATLSLREQLQIWWQQLRRDRVQQTAFGLVVGLAVLAIIWSGILTGQLRQERLVRAQAQVDLASAEIINDLLQSRADNLYTENDNLQASNTDLQSENDNLQATVTGLQTENDALLMANQALQDRLGEQDRLFVLLADPNVQTIAIAATSDESGAYGQVTISNSTHEAIVSVAQLNPLPEHHEYQLWLIGDSDPVPAGIFSVDDVGSQLVWIESADPATFHTVGVSIEPTGGSPQPTGEIVLLGSRADP